MTTGAWRRWADHPSPDDLPTRMREDAKRHWLTLTGWLRERYGLDGEIAWTDEDLGWVLRYRRNDRSLVTLLPTAEGGFSALVVLGPALWDAVDELDLGPGGMGGVLVRDGVRGRPLALDAGAGRSHGARHPDARRAQVAAAPALPGRERVVTVERETVGDRADDPRRRTCGQPRRLPSVSDPSRSSRTCGGRGRPL